MRHAQSYYQHKAPKKRFSASLVSAITSTLLCIAGAALLLLAAYYGMSRELCARDLPAAEYQAMKLDCKDYN